MKKLIGGGCCGKKKGFTLIELLIVVAIIGLLATLAILSLTSAQAKARDTKRVADLKSIQNALEMYFNDNSAYPVPSGTNAWSSTTSGTSYYAALVTGNYLQAMPAPPNSPNYWVYSTVNGYCVGTILEKDNAILDQDNDTGASCGITPTSTVNSADGTSGTSCAGDGTSGAYVLCLKGGS